LLLLLCHLLNITYAALRQVAVPQRTFVRMSYSLQIFIDRVVNVQSTVSDSWIERPFTDG
jgi:hypothetical protein